jgi:hypothetical protein
LGIKQRGKRKGESEMRHERKEGRTEKEWKAKEAKDRKKGAPFFYFSPG